MKETAKKIFLIGIVLLCVGYMLATAVLDLINKKDLKTVSVDEAAEILEIEHSINGIIPTGKTHYYIGVNDSTQEACLIKASPGWYKKNFDEGGRGKASGSLTVTGLEKKPGKFEVERELAARVSEVEGVTLITEPGRALDLSYRLYAIAKIVLFLLAVVLVLWGKKIADSKETRSATEAKLFLLVTVVVLILLLKVLIG